MTEIKSKTRLGNDWSADLAKIKIGKKPCCNTKKLAECFKSFLSHASYCVILVVYTAIGAVIFKVLEHPYEVQKTAEVLQTYETTKQNFKEILWNLTSDQTNLSFHNWTEMIEIEIYKYENLLFHVARNGVDPHMGAHYRWTYSAALFFSATVISTIGYGNISPVTLAGRCFCVGFALFGIPILLLTVTDIGKFFADRVYKLYQLINKKIQCGSCRGKQKKPSQKRENLPYIVAIFILILYIAAGGAIFSQWEDWTFFESFYFCFITMTTIGFGDIIPRHQMFMLLCTLYIVIGLALTSMCIELSQKHYIQSFKKVKNVGKAIKKLPSKSGTFSISQESKYSTQSDANHYPEQIKVIDDVDPQVSTPLIKLPSIPENVSNSDKRNSIIFMQNLKAKETKV